MLASSVSCARTLATSVRALPRATGSLRTFPANIVVGSRSYAQKKSSEAKEPATSSQAEEPDLAEPVSLSKLVIEQKKYSKDTLQSAAVVMKRRKQQAAREALGGEPLYSEAAQDAKPLPEPPKLTELSHTHPFFERVEDPDWEDDSIEKPVPPKMEKPPRSMSFAELLSKKVKKVNACMFCKQTAPGSLAQATNRGMNVKDPMIYYAPYNDPMNTPLLVQFMTAMGNILPRRYTGTCAKHQRALAKTIKRARHMGFFATKSSNYTIQSPYMTDLGETGKPYDPTAPENLPQREDYRSTEDVPLVVVGGRQ